MKRMLFLILLIFPCYVIAAPADIVIPGTITHGGTMSMTGTGFLAKSPAPPLMWDDGEGGTPDNPPTGIANSDSQVGYSEWMPIPVRNGEAVPEDWRMLYRGFPYTPEGESGSLTPITAPHQYSTQALSGGHYWLVTMDGLNPARDVQITIADSTGKERWFSSFYYRLNSDWPTDSSSNNHKFTCVQTGTDAYTPESEFSYMDFSTYPSEHLSYVEVKHHNHGGVVTNAVLDSVPDSTPPWDYNQGNRNNLENNTPIDGWIKIEERFTNDLGYRKMTIDNEISWWGTNHADWFSDHVAESGNPPRSYTLGGYYRREIDPPVGGEQSSDAHRLFDDIYVDSTLSRVVLTDNATYDSSTIVEPQPPTAWSTTAITTKVNLGKLTESPVYVFVFDSNGDRSSTGVAVTIAAETATFSSGTGCTGCKIQ